MGCPMKQIDIEFGRIVDFLQKHGLEAHTSRSGKTIVCKKKPKKEKRNDK